MLIKMLIGLLVLLNSYVTATTTYYPENQCGDASQGFRLEILSAHNNLRGRLARGEIEQDDGSKLKGSKTLFKFNYDCNLEALAMAAIPVDCSRRPAIDLSPLGRSQNLAIVAVTGDPSKIPILQATVNAAIFTWADRLNVDLLKNPTYTNKRMAPFANMIYNQSLSLGCMGYYCSAGAKTAIVCVYSDIPKIGAPLYWDDSNDQKGCNKTSCEQVTDVAKPKCDRNAGPNQGLCGTATKILTTTVAPPTTPSSSSKSSASSSSSSSPASSTSAKPTTTTKPASTEAMTEEIRNKIITMHNYRRTIVAQGTVRNGKEGNPNCPMATNMYEMRYDMALEAEAQAYADTCSTGPSGVQTSGENVYHSPSTTISFFDAVVKAQQSWFSVIYRNGVNPKMKYTRFLEQKDDAPTAFTQMVWAKSYKIGCGVRRCSSSTFVVCRYSPRGNIYDEFIYYTGTTPCAMCLNACKDALCPAPSA
ncbi:hypothetical protein Y032_0010g1034 [Ancylostoma ceylanicum]|nr:hypothetical protein Y032_0010g1034 [Ancylostoma ceylanicum]